MTPADAPSSEAFTLPMDTAARRATAANPVLSAAPWLVQPNGSPKFDPARNGPSLVFPAGTTYREAVIQLIDAVSSAGALPKGARLGPPLPVGVVFDQRSGRGVALDLQAPLGYDPDSGLVAAPLLELPGDWPQEKVTEAVEAGRRDGRPPIGSRPSVPYIPDCQTMAAYDSQPPQICKAAR